MNQLEEISVKELNMNEDISDCVYDWVIYKIGMFFKTHDRDKSYFVKDYDSSLGIGLETDYAKYGIYFAGMKTVNKVKTYLFLLSSTELFEDHFSLTDIHDLSKHSPVEVIITDIQELPVETIMKIYEYLDIPNCTILNRITINPIYTEENENIDFLDMSEFGSLADNSENNTRLNALYNQVQYIKSVGKGKSFALKLKDTENKMCTDVFDGLVASYAPRGYNFCTDTYRSSLYFENMVKMYSLPYMKIVHYFDMLRDHLNFGIYVSNVTDSKMSSKYRRCDKFLFQMDNDQVPKLILITMPIDGGRLQRQTKKVILPLDKIQYSEIDPKYLPFADQYLTECNIVQNVSLHCSNTFKLEVQDREFLAYFIGFENEMECKIAPLDKSLRWANITLGFDKYAHVLPITLFEDGEKYVQKIFGDRSKSLQLVRPTFDYMDYFAAAQMQFKTGRMNIENCLVPMEAIGMYFIYTNAVRTKNCENLFKHFSKKSLWDMNFLTYYGGPLPGLQRVFTFGYGDLL